MVGTAGGAQAVVVDEGGVGLLEREESVQRHAGDFTGLGSVGFSRGGLQRSGRCGRSAGGWMSWTCRRWAAIRECRGNAGNSDPFDRGRGHLTIWMSSVKCMAATWLLTIALSTPSRRRSANFPVGHGASVRRAATGTGAWRVGFLTADTRHANGGGPRRR